jgi:hypothetical protein|tara:strand:- start:98 stop:316 length:219 start_codon:yes stop_codon:yes gene_type:complete
MILASEEVMNNDDLRRVIWKYLKKDSRVRCITCKNLYKQEKMLRYPYKDAKFLIDQCMICAWTANTRDILGK